MKSAESIPTNETSKEFLLEKACHWENALIRSAFESLQKFVRLTQRSLEKEIQQLIKTMNDEIKIAVKNKDTTKIKNELEKHKERLNKLKEQILKAIKLEKDFLKTIHERLEHLMVPYKILKNHPVDLDINSWFKIKFNRILADYLLRFGYYQTSKELCNLEKLDSLVDSNIYKVIQKIIKNLQNKKCVQALKWCVENRTRLRKLNSSFEFNLRVQEYIQLLEAKKRQPAIDYARKWFSGFYSTHSGDIQKLMGCLAFISDIPNSPYSHLLSPSRWDKLISEFKSDACKLFGLPPFSSLLIDLQAGLSVLKTDNCLDEEEKLLNCPVCHPPFTNLAKNVPFARKQQSILTCRISGKIMDDRNPPMALPNGHVYSKLALEEMAAANFGKIICPRTQSVCSVSTLKKVFIT